MEIKKNIHTIGKPVFSINNNKNKTKKRKKKNINYGFWWGEGVVTTTNQSPSFDSVCNECISPREVSVCLIVGEGNAHEAKLG